MPVNLCDSTETFGKQKCCYQTIWNNIAMLTTPLKHLGQNFSGRWPVLAKISASRHSTTTVYQLVTLAGRLVTETGAEIGRASCRERV